MINNGRKEVHSINTQQQIDTVNEGREINWKANLTNNFPSENVTSRIRRHFFYSTRVDLLICRQRPAGM